MIYSRMTDFPQTKLSNIGKDSTVNGISKAKKNKKKKNAKLDIYTKAKAKTKTKTNQNTEKLQ